MRLKVDQLARTAIDQEQELLSRVHLELCEACGSRLGSSEGLCWPNCSGSVGLALVLPAFHCLAEAYPHYGGASALTDLSLSLIHKTSTQKHLNNDRTPEHGGLVD